VSFRYAGVDSDSLSRIDMNILKGQVVGVIGHSGAGKSTLINVLSGLLTPHSGSIYVDSREVQGDALSRWQVGMIGYVPQSPYICDGTLAENVAFGLSGDEIDSDQVVECCRMAAIDFLDDLPQGIATPIGERGVRLSGGQQQRVAIARALYKKPEIIIFDEATSSLDTKSEKAIQETVYSLRGSVTLIVVAHRLSTVADCDEVYWIDKGKVRMAGSAADVLAEYKES